MQSCAKIIQLSRRSQLMIFRTFVIGMVLVGTAIILTELHRYQVYKADIEREEEHGTR